MANPVKAWVATLYAGGFLSHGQSVTMTINITQQWEVQVQIGVVYGSNVSLPEGIFVYPSSDGGTNFDTDPLVSFSIATVASGNRRASVRLSTGQYVVEIRSSSPSVTVYAFTQEQITGVA